MSRPSCLERISAVDACIVWKKETENSALCCWELQVCHFFLFFFFGLTAQVIEVGSQNEVKVWSLYFLFFQSKPYQSICGLLTSCGTVPLEYFRNVIPAESKKFMYSFNSFAQVMHLHLCKHTLASSALPGGKCRSIVLENHNYPILTWLIIIVLPLRRHSRTSLVCLTLNEAWLAANLSHGKRCLQGSVKTTMTDCKQTDKFTKWSSDCTFGIIDRTSYGGQICRTNPIIMVHLARLQ